MNKHQIDGDGLLMVRFKVEVNNTNDFEIWMLKAKDLVKTFKGFINVTVLNRLKSTDYYVIVRFDCQENASAWLNSDERRDILNDSYATWLSEKQEVIHDWNIFWYRIFQGTKKWKQWTVTFIAVYPLTIVIPTLVKIIATFIPLFFFAGIISALLISGFMIYLVMPFVLNLFKKWLHK